MAATAATVTMTEETMVATAIMVVTMAPNNNVSLASISLLVKLATKTVVYNANSTISRHQITGTAAQMNNTVSKGFIIVNNVMLPVPQMARI